MDTQGNPPSVDSFYEATHKIRKGDKEGSWVSQQAQETYVSNPNVTYIIYLYLFLNWFTTCVIKFLISGFVREASWRGRVFSAWWGLFSAFPASVERPRHLFRCSWGEEEGSHTGFRLSGLHDWRYWIHISARFVWICFVFTDSAFTSHWSSYYAVRGRARTDARGCARSLRAYTGD